MGAPYIYDISRPRVKHRIAAKKKADLIGLNINVPPLHNLQFFGTYLRRTCRGSSHFQVIIYEKYSHLIVGKCGI
jgi:hypothetical protein